MRKIINIYFCTLLTKFKNIKQIALNDIGVQEIDLASKFLFDPKTGIIKFLLDNDQKQRLHLLEFLFLYIQKVRSDIEPYSIKIRDACFTLQHHDEAFVRATSFKPMVAMLDSSIRIIDSKKNAHGRYTSTNKMQQSVKVMAEILTTMGIIAYRFPEHSEKDPGFDYISDHSNIFGHYYLQHYREVWACLWKCRDHKNNYVRRAASKSIGEFLKKA
ncbi:27951_t:CDS:2, partial [Gigaspora margarita]